eukprot:COSAG01_NODE_3622_length_5858_cov_1194.967187_9_plen_251_part_00
MRPNSQLPSRRGRGLPLNASGLDTHRDLIITSILLFWTAECEVLLARGQFVTELLVVERGWAKLSGTGDGAVVNQWGAVSHLCARIGSPCLRHCVHGASIGGGDSQSWRGARWLGCGGLHLRGGESKRPAVESPWSQLTGKCQHFGTHRDSTPSRFGQPRRCSCAPFVAVMLTEIDLAGVCSCQEINFIFIAAPRPRTQELVGGTAVGDAAVVAASELVLLQVRPCHDQHRLSDRDSPTFLLILSSVLLS